MDDEAGRKAEPQSCLGVSWVATAEHSTGGREGVGTRCAVDGTVDASTGYQGTVRGVDDGVDLDSRDVSSKRSDHRCITVPPNPLFPTSDETTSCECPCRLLTIVHDVGEFPLFFMTGRPRRTSR